MSLLAISASFEYPCYGLRPMQIFYAFGAGIDFRYQNRRQILTSKVGPRSERVNQLGHFYSPSGANCRSNSRLKMNGNGGELK